MFNYIRVELDNGFIGYAPTDEFFIIGSYVDVFESEPKSIRDFHRIKRVSGFVKRIDCENNIK